MSLEDWLAGKDSGEGAADQAPESPEKQNDPDDGETFNDLPLFNF
jgi:hypothetical protein